VVSLRWENEYIRAVDTLRGPDHRQIRFVELVMSGGFDAETDRSRRCRPLARVCRETEGGACRRLAVHFGTGLARRARAA